MTKARRAKKIKSMIEEELKPVELDKPQIIRRSIIRCERCDAVNSFVQIEGIRKHEAFGQATARCKRCGHRAKIKEFS